MARWVLDPRFWIHKPFFGLNPPPPRTETCGVLANKAGTRQHNKILVSGTIGAIRLCSDNRISCGPTPSPPPPPGIIFFGSDQDELV